MKMKIVYIVGFLLCFSCSNNVSKKEDTAVKSEEIEIDKDGLVDDADFKSGDVSFIDFNTEIEEKLRANYESLVLINTHPEFQEAIKEQLATSTKFNVLLSDSIQSIEIKYIEFKGNLKKVNDSIYKQKILYTTFINSKHIKKDSAFVIIKRTILIIDNSLKMNTSFSFEILD
ncbi:hypothetical protein IMCC3317_20200 [Kordia antarctica]|uniref:Uncharacterized protein n=1 Tax=Kordia antarctica TaxID=1218801 RepID=A0A7L4ZJK6_9FLAO|nr:hypothetical protein [Kordia antarctica]QHI36657.1 hypothetical protein IMCC3317_20200 [Kordia antarctica]